MNIPLINYLITRATMTVPLREGSTELRVDVNEVFMLDGTSKWFVYTIDKETLELPTMADALFYASKVVEMHLTTEWVEQEVIKFRTRAADLNGIDAC